MKLSKRARYEAARQRVMNAMDHRIAKGLLEAYLREFELAAYEFYKEKAK